DSDTDAVTEGRRRGYAVTFGNAVRGDAMQRLGAADAAAVILTMDEPVAAQRIVRKLRVQFPDLPIIARARDAEHAALLYRAGATHAVPETLESSLQLSEAALVETGVALGPVIASVHEKRDEFRDAIMREGGLAEKPRLKSAGLQE
ncbi:NAD(P)-binding protein, partial [Novosphingobium sp.]